MAVTVQVLRSTTTAVGAVGSGEEHDVVEHGGVGDVDGQRDGRQDLVAGRVDERGGCRAGLAGVLVRPVGDDEVVGGVDLLAVHVEVDGGNGLQRGRVVAVQSPAVADPHRPVEGEAAVGGRADGGLVERGDDGVGGRVDGDVAIGGADPHPPVGGLQLGWSGADVDGGDDGAGRRVVAGHACRPGSGWPRSTRSRR